VTAAIAALAVTTALTAAGLTTGSAGAAVPMTPSAAPAVPPTLSVSIDVLVRTAVFPAESCCHWVARHSHEGFRDDTVDRCETGNRVTPPVYGVQTRQFVYRSKPPDRVFLDSARTTIVKFPGTRTAERFYRGYAHDGFDCRPRPVDGGKPRGGAAVFRVLRTGPARTVVADQVTESGSTLMRRYIDIRPIGRFVAIVEYELGEDIQDRPDLHRVDAIADAQQRRLERRMTIGAPGSA
jgi:hypothetical protein